MATNDESTEVFEESDLISLGQKLAALDLTEPERAALNALISEEDVAGFARFNIIAGIHKGRFGFDHQGPAGLRPGKRADGARAAWATPEIDIPKPGQF